MAFLSGGFFKESVRQKLRRVRNSANPGVLTLDRGVGHYFGF
jgi:hypothetical protein